MTPSRIEPATFRLVAQYLNYCATISGPRCSRKVFEKYSNMKYIQIRALEAELFHAEGQIRRTNRYDEVTYHFSQFCDSA
jgi:hypothetical protein